MKAEQIMTRDPRTVTPNTRMQDAAKLMRTEDVGLLPVVESEGSSTLVGVITDRDITIKHVAEGHATPDCDVSEAMSERIVTAKPGDEVEKVMDLMGREQLRRIPIVDERGALVGIVAQADIVRQAPNDEKAERTVERISEPSGRHTR